jgi:DNA invertase Pin-like site-specific DNA recombinase
MQTGQGGDFREQVSSVAKRAKLAECLAFLRDGDVLIVTKPDRLARSTAELLSIEADLTKRGIGLVVLSMDGKRLDTRKPTSKLMLTILGRRRDVGARDHAGAAARGHRHGEGGGHIQGPATEHRPDEDQGPGRRRQDDRIARSTVLQAGLRHMTSVAQMCNTRPRSVYCPIDGGTTRILPRMEFR